MCTSHFASFSVFLAIFQVLSCEFLIFLVGQFSRHIPGPTVCVFHFARFSVFLTIFQLLTCEFLIYFVSFFRNNPVPIVCVSHFPCFSVFSTCSRSYSVYFFHFSRFSVFLGIFQVLSHEFLFSMLVTFCAIFQVLQCTILIFHLLSVSCHISGLSM